MRILLASVAAVLAAGLSLDLTAQSPVRASLATADVVGVNANRQTDLARGGVAIDPSLGLRANDERDAFSSSLAAVQNDRGTGASFRWSARAVSGNTAGTLAGNPPAVGAQTYTLSLLSRQPVQGRVVVLFGGEANSARCGASVRIGRVQKDFAANGSPQRDAFENVTVDSSGVDVTVTIGGTASADANTRFAAYNASLNVLFVADTGSSCTVTAGASSCADGGTLRGAATSSTRGGSLALGLQGALPGAIGITVVSPSPRVFEIGQTGCVFFGTAIVHGTFTTDASGNARTVVDFPMIRGGNFSVQQATVLVSQRGVRFATSNTLDVSCN